MTTAQEKLEELWRGQFGNSYTLRQNINPHDTLAFFEKALDKCTRFYAARSDVRTVIEFGANVGHNLEALSVLLNVRKEPFFCQTAGVEINDAAWEQLKEVADVAIHDNILECDYLEPRWDLAFTKGVLIHIHPGDLLKAYKALYNASRQYILIAEYFNPTPVEVSYRGHEEALWKRDFGGDMLDTFPDLKCIDYGFVWNRDKHPQDNLTWWLFEKEEA